jgi:hypothetical protein
MRNLHSFSGFIFLLLDEFRNFTYPIYIYLHPELGLKIVIALSCFIFSLLNG